MLNGFLKQVVVSRRDLGIRKWVHWLREDLSSRPYAWLRPDFVTPSALLVVKDPQTGSSRISDERHLIDADFRKAWMPFFCRSGHPVVTLDFVGHVILLSLRMSSWILLVISCLRRLIWIFLGLLVGICRRLLVLKSLLLVDWTGGLVTRLRRYRCLGFLVWLFF